LAEASEAQSVCSRHCAFGVCLLVLVLVCLLVLVV